MKIKRGYRYQVSEPKRGNERDARANGVLWLVLDCHSGEDQHPIVASETSRAKARALAYKLNQHEWLASIERKEKERDQKPSVSGP